ncbi:hypothetical protein BGZ80_000705, partial [Entomortierella chlamydospora]
MAFQSMASGAECSSGANPLRQLTKPFFNENPTAYDQFRHDSSQQAGPSMRTARPVMAGDDQR